MNARTETTASRPFSGVMHVYTGNRYGGVESMLVAMAKSPLFAGQSYALMFGGRLQQELEAAGADVVRVGRFRARYPWKIPGIRARLSRALSERSVHTVVTHMSIPHALAAAVVGERVLVYFAHEFHIGNHWTERWAKWSRPPDAAVCNSAFVAPSVHRLFPGVETSVVYCPVEPGHPGTPEDRQAIRRELATPEEHKVILTTARLSPYKGHHLLLEGLGRLRKDLDWTAWIAGGPQSADEVRFEASLRERANELAIADRIRFLGERSDIPRLLAGADIHCQPNVGPEHFGISFVEALWAGIPVVTTAHGGALEIVTDDLGELVPPSNPTALAEALMRCMHDPAKAASARLNGPARASSLCAPDAFARRLDAALSRARNRKG